MWNISLFTVWFALFVTYTPLARRGACDPFTIFLRVTSQAPDTAPFEYLWSMCVKVTGTKAQENAEESKSQYNSCHALYKVWIVTH